MTPLPKSLRSLTLPRWRDLVRYCRNTGWEEIPGGDHYRFRKVLPDGSILRTRASRALAKEIPGGLFDFILKHQLRTDRGEFNAKSRR